MRSRTTDQFRRAFASLPKEVRAQARRAYRQFATDPKHPRLRFKRIHPFKKPAENQRVVITVWLKPGSGLV